MTFLFLQKNYILTFFVSQKEKKTYFFSLWFSRRDEPKYLSLVFQERILTERVFTQREIERNKIIKKIIIFFNSGSFWVVIKLPETVPPFSHLFGSGQVSPLGHPNPTLTSPTYIRWVELAQSLIQVHSIPLLKVIHTGKWVV